MFCGVIGIHARSSSLSLREIFAKACSLCFSQDHLATHLFSLIPLLTCNRAELYFSAKDLASAHSELLAYLREEMPSSFEQNLYSFFGVDAFSHLVEVTCGLDSMIIGETDIQGQVKKAYAQAAKKGKLSADSHFLFQKTLKIAKEMRSRDLMPKSRYCIPSMIEHLIKTLPKENEQPHILMIGNSDINKKITHYLSQSGIKPKALLTRFPEAVSLSVDVLMRDQFSNWGAFDIVISATSSPHYIIKKEHLDKSNKKPYLIFDLSVPRTIDPRVAQDPAIQLFNIESIHSLLDNERKLFDDRIDRVKDNIRFACERQCAIFENKMQKGLLCIA